MTCKGMCYMQLIIMGCQGKKKTVLLVCCRIPFWPAIAPLLVLRLIISQVALTLKYFTGIVDDSQFQVQLACQ